MQLIRSYLRMFCTVLFIYALVTDACPTCVGQVTEDSPLFFSDEFYQPQKELPEAKEPSETPRNYSTERQ